MAYTLFIPGDPPKQTHQSSLRAFRIGKFCRIVKAKPTQETMLFHAQLLGLVLGYKTKEQVEHLIEGPAKVMIEFNFAHNKSTPKSKADGAFPKITRPDLDNMAKTVLDGLTAAGCWKDDAQVSNLQLIKRHSTQPGTFIYISHDNQD